MSSQKKGSDADLEYQYVGEEVTSEDSSLEAPQKPASPLHALKAKLLERLPKKKKYRVMLYIAIAIYVAYKFIHVDTPPAHTKTTPEKIASQELSKPAQEPRKEKPVEKKPVEVAKPVQSSAAVIAPITTATKDLYDAPTVDAEHDNKLKALQSNLDQANQLVTTLESSLLNLTGSVIRLSNKVNTLENARKESLSSAHHTEAVWVYYLKSLVPGRAWVISPSGDYTSVKVGDPLPGYGQVQKIDVRANAILTSSGRIIKYGPNDS